MLFLFAKMSSTSNTRVVPVTVQLQRKTSVEDFSERVVNMLDEIERRVEQLRYVVYVIKVKFEGLRLPKKLHFSHRYS